MALQKSIEYRGFNLEYWVIFSSTYLKENNTTNVSLVVYKDKIVRDDSVNNYIRELTKNYSFEGNKSIAECYYLIQLQDEFFMDSIDC